MAVWGEIFSILFIFLTEYANNKSEGFIMQFKFDVIQNGVEKCRYAKSQIAHQRQNASFNFIFAQRDEKNLCEE